MKEQIVESGAPFSKFAITKIETFKKSLELETAKELYKDVSQPQKNIIIQKTIHPKEKGKAKDKDKDLDLDF